MDSTEPMVKLAKELRSHSFEVRSVTREYPLADPVDPVLRITTPDHRYQLDVRESDYFADPAGVVSRLRHHLRKLGYPC